MTQADALSAEDILAGLPNRVHEVIVRHVAERPGHAAFVDGGRVWSYGAFADAVEAVVGSSRGCRSGQETARDTLPGRSTTAVQKIASA